MTKEEALEQALDDAFIGAVIEDRFLITEQIGRGGMSTVYKARHKQIDLTVAIKILHTHFSSETEGVERFRREAGIVNRLNHPNVVHTLSFGILTGAIKKLENDGSLIDDDLLDAPRPYLILEHLEGKGLDLILEQKGRLGLASAKNIIKGVCLALASAHEQNVVHRDIKPSNVMIVTHKEEDESGLESVPYVKVLDFGISKMTGLGPSQQNLTQPGYNFGSPLYMSPEQCTGADLDSRSDIYSLGCMYYEMLAGRPPLEGKNPLHTFAMHIYEHPQSINNHLPESAKVPRDVEDLIKKCMHKSPDERFKSITEVLAAVKALN